MYEVVDHYNQQLEKNPIKFMLKEIYILNRIKGDPFQVAHIIPLGTYYSLVLPTAPAWVVAH